MIGQGTRGATGREDDTVGGLNVHGLLLNVVLLAAYGA